ncbi:unnamed protein product [Nesidiocoris tenuis]|uniref:Uncharacterized protein n=1 Tax=Nesidiocoris tenuis TaxID=355587 RepID=A0A6H5G7D1_9HEMI|nr:unnamed protein product [Nesidiocoris tenuis]
MFRLSEISSRSGPVPLDRKNKTIHKSKQQQQQQQQQQQETLKIKNKTKTTIQIEQLNEYAPTTTTATKRTWPSSYNTVKKIKPKTTKFDI